MSEEGEPEDASEKQHGCSAKKLKLPYDLAILLLGIYPKQTKSLSQTVICTHMMIAALFTRAKT